MSPLISIVVPVYNASKTIERCISSVLSQTFSQFELILIDDGSTDDSLAICEQFAMFDSRIIVRHQENKGVDIVFTAIVTTLSLLTFSLLAPGFTTFLRRFVNKRFKK